MGAGGLRQEVREALGRGAIAVTANERAARGLRRDWDEWLRHSGSDRWEPGAAMSWSAWTASLWRGLLLGGKTRGLLLNSVQEHAVWRGVLAADPDAGGLQGVHGLAAIASETWARICAYVEPGRRVSAGLRDDGSRDTAAFARWARGFERRCEAEGLVTAAELDGLLAESLRAGELRPEIREMVLVGFDRFTPAQERMLAELRVRGVSVFVPTSGVAPVRRVLTSAGDEFEELKACARWAAATCERDSAARIAVVVPDLSGERAMMERVFREVLAPELGSIAADEAAAPYEFSLGRPLAEMPLIAVALDLLRWGVGALPLEAVSGLIVSDYFAQGNGEREARAAFDAFELRRIGTLRPEITLSGMARALGGSRRSAKLAGLSGAVRRLARTAEEFSGFLQGHGAWAQGFRELLARAGWGPAGTETSEEFQIRERWESALDAMSTLDFEDRAVEYAEALQTLERIARETVFAPATRSAPVQVMGPMEAAGSEFDAVWFLRAGELSWPPEVRSLPLVSWSYQRDLRMPGTDAGRDLEAARATTERLLGSGREVVVSYAQRSGEARQRVSTVVRDMMLEGVTLEEIAGRETDRVPIAIERVEDGGSIGALPDRPVSGGVGVLELQAACGFRAFAEHRLWSRELESRDLGLDARESGTAVHRALELFWSEVESQARLVSMSEDELQATLSRAIEEGLESAESHSAGAWDEAYLATQRERLRRLLNGWLEMERARPAFVVREREEEMRDVQVGPLRLRLRVDRVDVVDEAQVLIDYKTGGASPAAWLGERPDSPQVPLYAILAGRAAEGAAPMDLGAVAFGTVRAGKEAKLKGFAARAGLLPGRLPRMDASTFEGQVDRWREVLERLAEEFAAGDARVRPKNYPTTCQRCGQRMLCRLDASLLEEMEEDGVGEGEDG